MRYVALSAIVLLAGCGDTGAPRSIPSGPILQQVRAALTRDERKWIDVRHDLHRFPELSGTERRTSALVAAELRQLGLDVRTQVGGYGVVGMLRGSRAGPLIAYRADMDAVATNTHDPVDYASRTSGVRHACGHDIHTTVALALATALRQVRDSLAGSVMFIFQPAEETGTGAKAMLADGLFSMERPIEIYGLHTAGHEQGRLATTAGPMRMVEATRVRELALATETVHAAHPQGLDAPIVGDRLYGRAAPDPDERLLLHAERLAFVHPVSGVSLDNTQPAPF